MCHRGIHRHTGVVAHMTVSTRREIEEGGLATVGISYQCHIQCTVLPQCHVVQVVVGMLLGGYLLTGYTVCRRGLHILFFLGDNLYHLCFLATQTDLIAHHLILHWVLQRSVQQHLHLLTPDKAHLNDALTESTVSLHLHNDTVITSLQLR